MRNRNKSKGLTTFLLFFKGLDKTGIKISSYVLRFTVSIRIWDKFGTDLERFLATCPKVTSIKTTKKTEGTTFSLIKGHKNLLGRLPEKSGTFVIWQSFSNLTSIKTLGQFIIKTCPKLSQNLTMHEHGGCWNVGQLGQEMEIAGNKITEKLNA